MWIYVFIYMHKGCQQCTSDYWLTRWVQMRMPSFFLSLSLSFSLSLFPFFSALGPFAWGIKSMGLFVWTWDLAKPPFFDNNAMNRIYGNAGLEMFCPHLIFFAPSSRFIRGLCFLFFFFFFIDKRFGRLVSLAQFSGPMKMISLFFFHWNLIEFCSRCCGSNCDKRAYTLVLIFRESRASRGPNSSALCYVHEKFISIVQWVGTILKIDGRLTRLRLALTILRLFVFFFLSPIFQFAYSINSG